MRGVGKLTNSWLLQSARMNDLEPMVIKVPYTYMPVYNQSSKKG